MDISTVRDVVISILGILYIILTVGIIVGFIFVFIKVKHLVNSIDQKLKTVHRWIAYIRGLAKGFNESLHAFNRGG